MKILMLSGSPKTSKSSSFELIKNLKTEFEKSSDVVICSTTDNNIENIFLENIYDSDAVILSFPLYVDALPSKIFKLLCDTEEKIKNIGSKAKVYILVNNGFYEPSQNLIAVDIVWKWAEKSNLKKGYALCIGAGPLISEMPITVFVFKNLKNALVEFKKNVLALKNIDDTLIKTNMPRFLYKTMGNHSWKTQAKKNGLKI